LLSNEFDNFTLLATPPFEFSNS